MALFLGNNKVSNITYIKVIELFIIKTVILSNYLRKEFPSQRLTHLMHNYRLKLIRPLKNWNFQFHFSSHWYPSIPAEYQLSLKLFSFETILAEKLKFSVSLQCPLMPVNSHKVSTFTEIFQFQKFFCWKIEIFSFTLVPIDARQFPQSTNIH